MHLKSVQRLQFQFSFSPRFAQIKIALGVGRGVGLPGTLAGIWPMGLHTNDAQVIRKEALQANVRRLSSVFQDYT